MLPESGAGARAVHDGKSHLVRDPAAVVRVTSRQEVLEFLILGHQSIIIGAFQSDGFCFSHTLPFDA